MTRHPVEPQLPRPGRWLLRLAPLPPESRADVHDDLHELFEQRRHERGVVHAHWRLYHDLASLWSRRHMAAVNPGSRSPLAWLRDVGGDLRYAVRLFARQPGILLLTIAGLSLGLGIATAAFSIMNAALRGEGVVDSDRAPGILRLTDQSVATVWAYDEFVRLREGATRMHVEAVMTDAAAVRTESTDAPVPSVGVAFVSGGFFAGTGGTTMLGRALEAADERHAGPPPVVVSAVFWATRLNRDRSVVGRTIRVGRTEATIVGVAERGFSVPSNRQLWLPLSAYGGVYDAAPVRRTPAMGLQVFGRLLPDASLSAAEAQLNGVAAALPASQKGSSPLKVRLDRNAGLGRVAASDAFAISIGVFAVIGLVLVLACANVASVLVATAITREREMGVRAALGADRWRIVRQLLTESLALGTVAAGVGLLCAYWAIPTIGRLIEAPAGTDLAPDLEVYLFLGLVTLVTGVGAGCAPAWHGRAVDLVTPLKGGESATHNRLAPRRLRSALVVTQAAVSVLLIVLATLFVRASFRAAAIDVGFDAAGLYAVSPGLGRNAFENDGAGIKNFWARAIPELAAVPGVTSVTLAELSPFEGMSASAVTRDEPPRVVQFNRGRSEYFDTVGLRISAGRTFTHAEVAAGAPVVLISQSLARAYFQDQSPLGQVLPREIPIPPSMAALQAKSTATPPRPVVIGVAADAVATRLEERSALTVYQPLDPANEVFAQLMIRVGPGTSGVIDEARQRLRAIDPQAEITVASVEARLQREASRPRMLATLTGVVGAIAIVLCVIGLYGLTASVVNQRTREMGVRVALGADPARLLRLMMWDSLRPVVVGLAIGAGIALLAGRVAISSMLFGVSPQDPIAFGGAAIILLGAAALAVIVPTRRVAAVDAAFVLRQS